MAFTVEKNVHFCGISFWHTGFGHSFPQEFVFSLEFRWNLLIFEKKCLKSKHLLSAKGNNAFFCGDVVLGGGGSYLQQLFEDTIERVSYGTNLLSKKKLGKNLIYRRNLVIFLYPRLIRILKEINFSVNLFLRVWFSTYFAFCKVFEGLILFLRRPVFVKLPIHKIRQT